jgi:hypothetical protein
MKTNAELEFINKVRELSEKMQELADFWENNSEVLEDAIVYKDYPFSDSFDDLALNTYNWLLALINNYCQKKPNNLYTIFNAYLIHCK